MNLPAHGLQRTWPHGIVSTALTVFVRFLSHDGQIEPGGSVNNFDVAICLKLIVIKDLRESECLLLGNEAGHNGVSFGGFASFELFIEGVREGTQKEGSVGLAAYNVLTNDYTVFV